ncbi:MAG: heat-inducible transcriptional repressor HrcA [Gammaproteobacteria bacterium]|nr:heat-inducible transcriptional repressor HrcA [Gammaproteobacteria bacterium]MDH4314566.1 heat-inducible transcriptional repressor HrcA [Gammaproteobacteria bacterium]MDH5213749.1 heat-inducible transcriptional repressor HrcA [Gammaproteobacteria bacterium]MDH5499612.1 heat-inducible transcriptional repressor HrcA [Gammaproteobacteria bacterium]
MTEAVSTMPNERAQYLLKVLIRRFIRDGQPVGSRTLSKDAGLELSPATIRNIMSDLEDLGLVTAPHTSAGRVPTAQGYRLFVDSLIRYKQPKGGDLRKLRLQIASKQEDPEALLSAVSQLLAKFTSLAGVVTVPRGHKAILRQIDFLPLSDSRVLAILVINDREVQNRILHTEAPRSADELRRAANFINENYVGMDLSQIREQLIGELEKTRDSMNRAMHDIITVAQSALEGASRPSGEYLLTGEANLMNFAELSDLETLRRLFDAFSRKRLLLDLLDRSINASGVQVFIGQESGYSILDNCSIVTAPYHVDDDHIGVLGVIGPTRMAYDRIVPIVDVTARLLESAMKGAHEPAS